MSITLPTTISIDAPARRCLGPTDGPPSYVAWGETSAGAIALVIAVVSEGIAAHGVARRLQRDNGAALNPSRRGVLHEVLPVS